ncbi:hypothetical protein BGW80DRAFT_74550 [Lactifluus volemus]|nr:hypothetical protein BGW80DRAFT_74550 [Lactifluus volemus]
MSGFDDLLRQSSKALEENPFEDPFAAPRSGSPDPWASLVHQSATVNPPSFEYDSTVFDVVPTTPPAVGVHNDSFVFSEVESHASGAPTARSDPLDSVNLSVDDEPESAAKPITSPGHSGFRESIEIDPPPISSQPSAHMPPSMSQFPSQFPPERLLRLFPLSRPHQRAPLWHSYPPPSRLHPPSSRLHPLSPRSQQRMRVRHLPHHHPQRDYRYANKLHSHPFILPSALHL